MELEKILEDLKTERIKKVIVNSDTFNEMDDQYAIAYALKNTDRISVRALYAAPFLNENSLSPADGMEKSYDEIVKLQKLMRDESVPVYKGSRSFMADPFTPVKSEAAEFIIEESKKFPGLTVIGIGAATNIASALLLDDTLLDPLGPGVVLPGRDRGVIGDRDGQLDVAEVVAQLVSGQILVQLGLGLPVGQRRDAARQHGDCQQQNPQFLHSVFLPLIFCTPTRMRWIYPIPFIPSPTRP